MVARASAMTVVTLARPAEARDVPRAFRSVERSDGVAQTERTTRVVVVLRFRFRTREHFAGRAKHERRSVAKIAVESSVSTDRSTPRTAFQEIPDLLSIAMAERMS